MRISPSRGRVRWSASQNSPSWLVWENATVEVELVGEALDLHLELAQRQPAVVRRRPAAEHVEVHAVQDLDAVLHPVVHLLDRRAQRRRVDLVAGGDLAGRLDEHERHAAALALLVALDQRQHVVDAAPANVSGSPRAASSSATSAAQRVAVRQPQRRQQPDADRLAVAVARVAGGRLDRVARRCGRG